ncbi:MAG: EamA family transporter [Lachnospiraceae bacterium]|nr:EamA family transporter [Lachnospiraceae bacterium]
MSIQMILLVTVILLVETCIASFASYCLKRSSSAEGSKLSMLLSPFFYLGGVLYVLSAGMSIVLLQFLPYAIVLPLGSLTYVWTLFFSRRLLGEEITKRKFAGVAVIICGVILLAAGQI